MKSAAMEAAKFLELRGRGFIGTGNNRPAFDGLLLAKRLRAEDRQRREYENFILSLGTWTDKRSDERIDNMKARIAKRRKAGRGK